MVTSAEAHGLHIVEPEHLETILINGILIPEFFAPNYVVRLFERQLTPGGEVAFVRIRVGISAQDFVDAIQTAAAAAQARFLSLASSSL